jgi:formate/nitrite transporter FocA (FNT family)
MLVTPRKGFVILLCFIALMFVAFGIVGDEGLWTLGGKVGISRTAIAVSICYAVAIILLALTGDEPFRPAP